jgi:4-hydroxy-2-oxoheptanedioate aldolase
MVATIGIISIIMLGLRERLLQNQKTYGTMLMMGDSPIAAELLASVGYDFMIVDHEHSATNIASGQSLLQAIDAANTDTEPIVRLPGHDRVYMKKVLDSMRLPGGVLIPMVDDAETARDIVQSIRYPTQKWEQEVGGGVRGCAVPFVRATGWGTAMKSDEYLQKCREELLVIVQVETPAAVEAIDDIAAVDGIDMIFLGPMDLSCSAGNMGEFEDKHVKSLLQTAEQKVRDSPCMLGGFRPPGRELNEMYGNAGYNFVCGSVDIGLLRDAARADVESANRQY